LESGGNGMKKQVLVIGAGGIGSLLVEHLARAFAFSGLSETHILNLTMMDSDVVESRNLPHQQFCHDNLSQPKVSIVRDRVMTIGITSQSVIKVNAIVEDFSAETDLSKYDLVVVAVDREEPRKIVHSKANEWLELRARGDGFVMWSHLDDIQILDSLPKLPEGTSASCQLDGAIETGNIQFGFALAAAHGAQWVVQWLRGGSKPSGKMYSIHMGELPIPEPQQGLVE
jgi:hypothetical protein